MAFILASLPSEEDFFPRPWLKFHFFLEDIVLVFMFEVGTARDALAVIQLLLYSLY